MSEMHAHVHEQPRPVAAPLLPHAEYERLALALQAAGCPIDATQVAWVAHEVEIARRRRERLVVSGSQR